MAFHYFIGHGEEMYCLRWSGWTCSFQPKLPFLISFQWNNCTQDVSSKRVCPICLLHYLCKRVSYVGHIRLLHYPCNCKVMQCGNRQLYFIVRNKRKRKMIVHLFQELMWYYAIIYYTNNECLWVQWYKYFHEVKDEMFHSMRQSRVEWNISSFTEWKYLFHCTNENIHYLFYITAK